MPYEIDPDEEYSIGNRPPDHGEMLLYWFGAFIFIIMVITYFKS
jgi:hypothetical protein